MALTAQMYQKIRRKYFQYRGELICRMQRNPLEHIDKTVVTIFHDFEGDYSSPGRKEPCLNAAEAILEIESKYGIRGTYNTVAKFSVDVPEFMREIQSHGHEIASHSYAHNLLSEMNRYALADDVRNAKILFSDLGIVVNGHRSPQSASSPSLFGILLKENYEWIAENGSEPYPYIYMHQGEKKLWRFPVHADDWNYEKKMYTPAQMLSYWKDIINLSRRVRSYTAIGIHPWIQSRLGRLEILDEFFEWLVSRDDVILMSFTEVLNMIKGGISGRGDHP